MAISTAASRQSPRTGLDCIRTLLTGLAVALTTMSSAAWAQSTQELVIITPHNEHIQQEFGEAFSAHMGKPIDIRWIKQGTGELIQLLRAKDRSEQGASFGIDVFFGGGVPDHDYAGRQGYLQTAEISDGTVSGIPSTLAGMPNYDDERLWYSTAISSFGILVNHRAREAQKLPAVDTWKDLITPDYYGWVVLADPRKSASNQVCYEAVLQQYGWEEGWKVLTLLCANARRIVDSSSAVPNEIATGNVIAGPAIDFYAYARISQAGSGTLGFVQPRGGTAITPDPISLLRKPDNKENAEAFIDFVLSPAGQRLWLLPAGSEGGPARHTLFRLPVRPDAYESPGVPSDVINPYTAANDGTYLIMDADLQTKRLHVLAELMGAGLIDLHDQLTSTWKAVIDGGAKPELVAELTRPPFSEEESLEIAKKLTEEGRSARRIVRGWISEFSERYENIRRKAGG